MNRKLLVSGDRADFTTLTFDVAEKELCISANYKAPFNASWIERYFSIEDVDHLVGLSEADESGLLFTFQINHEQQACTFTSEQPTLGAPAHLITLRDKSALALATYLGGSIALYPISRTGEIVTLLENAPRTEVLPPFSYESVEHGPNKDRQEQRHIHQVLEDGRGLIYAPDLGSDRVWVLRRQDMNVQVCGWLECPPGTGPRHAVLTPDETIMYVIGELSHTVVAFDLSFAHTGGVQPIEGFAPNIIRPSVQPSHRAMMDSGEISLHPTIPNILYVSNRWERHIAQREPHLKNVPEKLPPGDDVAIILLSDDGRTVQSIDHVRTNVDVIRGMRISSDGKYVVVVGQEGGGVEVYKIEGKRGDIWTLIVGLKDGLGGKLKHAIWL